MILTMAPKMIKMAAKNGVGPRTVVTILAREDEFENINAVEGGDLLNHERRVFGVVKARPEAASPSCYL